MLYAVYRIFLEVEQKQGWTGPLAMNNEPEESQDPYEVYKSINLDQIEQRMKLLIAIFGGEPPEDY